MANISKTQKERRAESDARIISSAIKCFGECGYTNTLLNHIAENAGITAALISQRFGTKEKLFDETYFHVTDKYYFDVENDCNARECLSALISQIKKINEEDPETFDFCCMTHRSKDFPIDCKKKYFAKQRKTNLYRILFQAQKEGNLPAGDFEFLMTAFVANVFSHIKLCRNYSFEIPNDEFYFKAINFVDEKNEDDCRFVPDIDKLYINDQVLKMFCKDFQVLWLADPKDNSLKVYKSDSDRMVPHSLETILKLKTYDEAFKWYIENFVVETYRKKLTEQTAMDFVLKKLEQSDDPFLIEYERISGDEINFNQLFYGKVLNPDTKEIEYILLGARSVDYSGNNEVDHLTGLLNRQSFFEKAEELLSRYPDKQFDVVLTDIVDYKKINETYGSDVADKVLQWHGKYLSGLENECMIIGRYGGDQMVIIGEHNYVHQCLSSEYRSRFLESEKNNGLPSVKFKYGIYLDIKPETSIISICDKAHMALNSIKSHYSKEIAYYTNDIKRHLEKQRIIEDCMYSSLENGDFKVYYQPKHDVHTGKLAGAEALIRWINPKYGFMSPSDFIPLFEQNGFIMEVDKFVGYKTCANLRKWMDKGINVVPVSINASMLTLFREDLVNDIRKSIEKFNLQPGQLHMEITETLMTENIEKLVGILNELRALGCKVELDDFGSGYSSLNILSEFPIDILKLDMSFMQKFGNKKRTIVLESCIDMAKKLGFETVSEGVELEEQMELLKKLGADMIQGYFYSKPLSEDEFEKYLTENQ